MNKCIEELEKQLDKEINVAAYMYKKTSGLNHERIEKKLLGLMKERMEISKFIIYNKL